MAIIDNFSKEQLEEIVNNSTSYKEVLQKLGYKTVGGNNNKTLKSRLEKYNINTSHFKRDSSKKIERTEENVFCINSTTSQAVLRRWFIKSNNIPYKCSICGINNWLGKDISLQLDHINGDNHDNRLENLRWLCPNCHSQTETFCGKQTKKNHTTKNGITKEKVQYYCIDCGKEITANSVRCVECARIARRTVERPDKEELRQILIQNSGNFVQVGRSFNVTDNTIRKWCVGYNLPSHSSDYKE